MEHALLQEVKRRVSAADPADNDMIYADANSRLWRGWSVDHVVALLRCMEEVTPDLAEAAALERMKKICLIYGEK